MRLLEREEPSKKEASPTQVKLAEFWIHGALLGYISAPSHHSRQEGGSRDKTREPILCESNTSHPSYLSSAAGEMVRRLRIGAWM